MMGERCLECGVNKPWHHTRCSRFDLEQQQREVNRRMSMSVSEFNAGGADTPKKYTSVGVKWSRSTDDQIGLEAVRRIRRALGLD